MTKKVEAKKQAAVTPAVQPQPPAPAPTPAVAAQPVAPSKQTQTLEKLKTAWTARGVDLSKMTVKPDGKFLYVTVGAAWPVIKLGPTGGIDLPEIKSYAKAFDAAVNADQLWQKQQERDKKKAATAAPAPTTPKPPAPTKPGAGQPEAKKETPTARKQKADAALEQRLSA